MTLRWKIAQAAEIRWWQRYLKNKPTAFAERDDLLHLFVDLGLGHIDWPAFVKKLAMSRNGLDKQPRFMMARPHLAS